MTIEGRNAELPIADDDPPQSPDVVFIVCGLGGLGRQCVALLKDFGVAVVGVDKLATAANEDGGGRLARFVAGDCAQAAVLRQAGIAQCRAILLVTSDERSNIAAAFTARSLNANVRLIIRSAQDNLNALLRDQLGNLIAFEPSQFSAEAFALASLGDDTLALFEIGGLKTRVARERVGAADDWRQGRPLIELNSARRRILSHASDGAKADEFFFPPDAERVVRAGDVVTFVESAPFPVEAATSRAGEKAAGDGPAAGSAWNGFMQEFARWRGRMRVAKTALLSLGVMLALTFSAILLFHSENPEISWFDATNVAIVLAIGGFDNVFGALHAPFPISRGLYLFSLVLTLASTVFLGVVFATLTGVVLSANLQIARRRRSAPVAGHTIVVGMGAIGRRIAGALREWRQPLVGVSEEPVAADILPDIAMQAGPLREALARANVGAAKSAIVVLDDQVANLEVSLLVRSLNPSCTIVFRTADQQLARNVASLVPSSTGISDYYIAAEAIAGAAFGENILTAFHLGDRSALVTEYAISASDTLTGRQLAEIAYGYGVAPIMHGRGGNMAFNPSDDIRLEPGDALFVLATVDGLRRVEIGESRAPTCHLRIESSPHAEASFAAANTIARISGCSLAVARAAMAQLPTRLEAPLYQPQGVRLARELRKLLVSSRLETAGGEAPASPP